MNGGTIDPSLRVAKEQAASFDESIAVPYLVKLLLQYENSPFMEDRDLVHCQKMLRLVCSIDSSGSYMSVACGRRIVVFPMCHHTHPLYFLTAVTPSPQELVTSVMCMIVDDSTVMVLVGTNDGWLHIHHPSMDNAQLMTTIHRQRVYHGPLSGIHMRDSTISIDTPDGVVLIDVVDVFSARQWFLKTRQMPDDVLPLRVFEFYTVGHRNTTQIHGHVSNSTKSLYDHMMSLNIMNAADDASKILMLSAGKEPPLAWYSLTANKNPSRGILSSILTMSSRMMFGYNRKGRSHLHDPEERQHHVLEQQEIDQGYIQDESGTHSRRKASKNTILASPYTNIWDDSKRECFGLTLCRSRGSHISWAACCDSLGRVLIIDVHEKSIYKMLKGYRDCQLAWIQSLTTHKDPLLLIYAPKRRSLELWDVCKGARTKVCALAQQIQVTDQGILLSCDRASHASSVAFLFDLRTCVIHRITIT